MDKIASFQINHLLLNPGIYVSRKDKAGDQILTTFDIRMTKPNYEPVMNTAEVHTIEHLGATFLRNNEEYKDRVIYFGPMGCRTGFYLILAGDYDINVRIHKTLSRSDPWSKSKRVRQLPGYESRYGELSCREIPVTGSV